MQIDEFRSVLRREIIQKALNVFVREDFATDEEEAEIRELFPDVLPPTAKALKGSPEDLCVCGCPRKDHLYWLFQCECGCSKKCGVFRTASVVVPENAVILGQETNAVILGQETTNKD